MRELIAGMIVQVRAGEEAARCLVYRVEDLEALRQRFGPCHMVTAHVQMAAMVWPSVRVAWLGEPITVPEEAKAAGIEAASHVFPVLIASEGGELKYLQLHGAEIAISIIANPGAN